MSDVLRLQGSISTQSDRGAPSGDPATITLIDETVYLQGVPLTAEYHLIADLAQVVALGPLASAGFVMVKARGGKVKARITTTDGATQAVPVDSFAVWISDAVPVTAIDLTRVAGVETWVTVILGQLA